MNETHVVNIAPIGVIRSPFRKVCGTPIQSSMSENNSGVVEIFPEYARGLRDLEDFERIWLVYYFHKIPERKLTVAPFLDTVERGVFATRSPARPNAIGISCVKLIAVEHNILRINGIDILDGTPLLDIKPYVKHFDAFPDSESGWYESVDCKSPLLADSRFAKQSAE